MRKSMLAAAAVVAVFVMAAPIGRGSNAGRDGGSARGRRFQRRGKDGPDLRSVALLLAALGMVSPVSLLGMAAALLVGPA